MPSPLETYLREALGESLRRGYGVAQEVSPYGLARRARRGAETARDYGERAGRAASPYVSRGLATAGRFVFPESVQEQLGIPGAEQPAPAAEQPAIESAARGRVMPDSSGSAADQPQEPGRSRGGLYRSQYERHALPLPGQGGPAPSEEDERPTPLMPESALARVARERPIQRGHIRYDAGQGEGMREYVRGGGLGNDIALGEDYELSSEPIGPATSESEMGFGQRSGIPTRFLPSRMDEIADYRQEGLVEEAQRAAEDPLWREREQYGIQERSKLDRFAAEQDIRQGVERERAGEIRDEAATLQASYQKQVEAIRAEAVRRGEDPDSKDSEAFRILFQLEDSLRKQMEALGAGYGIRGFGAGV